MKKKKRRRPLSNYERMRLYDKRLLQLFMVGLAFLLFLIVSFVLGSK